MSRMTDIYGGRFLKGVDLAGRPVLLTIERAAFEKLPDFNNPSAQNERLVFSFAETGKDIAVNGTSGRNIIAAYGEDETKYVGQKIVAYPERMNIGGKLIDVVMLRAPRNRQGVSAPAAIPAPTSALPPVDPSTVGDFDDDIPF
jgi:hypothetical protein